MPLTEEEQLELDSLNNEAGLTLSEQQELDSLNEEGGFDLPTVFDGETAGQVYDASADAQIPINEAENLYAMTAEQKPPISDGIVKRIAKGTYNASIANVVTAVSTKSQAGQMLTDVNSLQGLEVDFRRRLAAGESVTDSEVEHYAKPFEKGSVGSIFGMKQDDWKVALWKDYEEGNVNVGPLQNPEEAISKYLGIEEQAKQETFEETDVSMKVSPASGAKDKVADAFAVLLGYGIQVGVLSKASPSMPQWLVWENVNIANGGTPGHGAAMQLTLGGLGKAIPGVGFTPALQRGAVASGLFGTTTYLGGGDTTDVLIAMGIPFAFEGVGMTKQSWAKYKNKKQMIDAIKKKAPALKDRSDIDIEGAVSKLLTNVEMKAEFGKKPTKQQDMSAELKAHMQRVQYDKLLEKANSGNKKAVKDLNDFIQGKNIPTYEQLLEKGFNGDQSAFDKINLGQYKGGGAEPAAEFKTPKTKKDGAAFKQKTKKVGDFEEYKTGNKKLYVSTKDPENVKFFIHDKGHESGTQYTIQTPTGKKTFKGWSSNKDVVEKVTGLKLEQYEKNNTIKYRLTEKPVESYIPDYEPKTRLQKLKEGARFTGNADAKPGKLDAKTTQKSRERGYITSTKEVLPELKIEGQYIPRATDPLAIKARNLVKDDIVMAEKVRHGTTDKAVATSSELIKHYGEKARSAKTSNDADMFYEKAATVASETAVILTEAGRTIQAASILGRLTPEGQLRFAAKEIQRYNETVKTKKGGIGGLKKQIPELTAQQAKEILSRMEKIQNMPEGKERFIEFDKLQRHITGLIPTPLYNKIVTTWKAGLLTGIKTSGLNIMSNASHIATETIKDIPASMVDKAISYFTGKRTVTPTIKGLKKGSIEGAGKGFEYLKSGYSERDIGMKLDYNRVNMGKGNTAKALQAYTEGVFRTLGAEDQPFYYAAKLRSMYQQAKASALTLKLKGKKAQAHIDTLMENPTEKMIKNSSMDAETAVYINATKLGDIARGIQRLPGGEIVVPFGRTPSAVAMQIVNYSPVGSAKTIIQNIGKGRFDQRAFSQGIGRGLTGTAVMAIGVAMFDNDMVSLDYPKTERERKLWELEGRIPNSIKIGDKWRTVQSFGPAGNLLIVGGHFRRAYLEVGSPTEAMVEAMGGSAKTFTEQTFMRGVNQFVDLVSDPERSASYVAGGMISSIIPTIVGDVARATDTKDRQTNTIGEKVKSRIPGARQTLEPKVTVLGEEKEPTANPLELMIDPTRPSKEISTPVIDELRRLWDQGWEVSPNKLGDRKGYDVLTPEENTELWKRAGTLTKDALNSLIGNELYEQLPDETKADNISKLIEATQKAAKVEMVAKKLTGLEDSELAEAVFDLRKSGLADQDIIPIALSKRNPRKAMKDKK